MNKTQQRHAKYYRENLERFKENGIKFLERNPGYVQKWRESHPERAKEIAENWRKTHLDRAREVAREWNTRNPVKVRHNTIIQNHKRRVVGEIDIKAFDQKYLRLGSRCYYCGKYMGEIYESIDHVQPIEKQGTNHIDNLVPACLSCNQKKHTKTLNEWIQLHGLPKLFTTN